jgi:hypothetical protein
MANSTVVVVGYCTKDMHDLTTLICKAFPEINNQFSNFVYDPRARRLAVPFKYEGDGDRLEQRELHVYLDVAEDEYASDNVPVGPKVVFSVNVWGKSVEIMTKLADTFADIYGNIHFAKDDGGDFVRYER